MLNDFSENNSSEEPKAHITKRELEILQLVVKEFTTKEISEQLTISINTIDTHRKNIMKKLKVKNTIGLVKYAIRNDLV
jgi:DNA-binding NarL/FixJ family response regulator